MTTTTDIAVVSFNVDGEVENEPDGSNDGDEVDDDKHTSTCNIDDVNSDGDNVNDGDCGGGDDNGDNGTGNDDGNRNDSESDSDSVDGNDIDDDIENEVNNDSGDHGNSSDEDDANSSSSNSDGEEEEEEEDGVEVYHNDDDDNFDFVIDADRILDKQFESWCEQLGQNIPSITNIFEVNLCTYQRVHVFGCAVHCNNYITDMTINIYGLDSSCVHDDSADDEVVQQHRLDNVFLSYLQNSTSLERFGLNACQHTSDLAYLIRSMSRLQQCHPSDCILSAIALNTNICQVEIDEINLYNSLAELISTTTSIRKLDIRFCTFHNPDSNASILAKEGKLRQLTTALEQNCTIQFISIRSISDIMFITSILDGIKGNRFIQDVCVSTPDDDSINGAQRITESLKSLLIVSPTIKLLELIDFDFSYDTFQPIADGINQRCNNNKSPLDTLSLLHCSFQSTKVIDTFQQVASDNLIKLRLGGQFMLTCTDSTRTIPTVLSTIIRQSYKAKQNLVQLDLEELEIPSLCTDEFCDAIVSNTTLNSLATPLLGIDDDDYNRFVNCIPHCSLRQLDVQLVNIDDESTLMVAFKRNLSLEKVILNSLESLFEEEHVIRVHEYCSRNKAIRQSLQLKSWNPTTEVYDDSDQQQDEDLCPITTTSLWPLVFESIQDCECKHDVIFKCLNQVLIDSIGTYSSYKRPRLI